MSEESQVWRSVPVVLALSAAPALIPASASVKSAPCFPVQGQHSAGGWKAITDTQRLLLLPGLAAAMGHFGHQVFVRKTMGWVFH